MTKLETGYSYKYTPEKESEDSEARDRDRTCCGCGESSMERSPVNIINPESQVQSKIQVQLGLG